MDNEKVERQVSLASPDDCSARRETPAGMRVPQTPGPEIYREFKEVTIFSE